MPKLFWVCWCLLLLAFVASYFRSVAFDFRLTHTIWIQVATADGGARLVVLNGDPAASWTANTVIERDKNTWRYGLSTATWGRMSYHEAPVDTLGTLVGTVRIDMPLLAPLLIPLVFMVAAWAMKRWGAPPRLVWAELWMTPRFDRGALGIVRRVLLVVSIVFTLGAALLWAGSYLDPLPRWRYFGDRLAFVTGKDDFDFSVLLNRSGAGPNAFAKGIAEIIDERIDEFGRPEKYFSIEIMRERITFRYYTSDVPVSVAISAKHRFVGFEYRHDRVEMPAVVSPFPSRMMPPPGAGAMLGVERMVEVRLWSPVILFSLWPLLCFFRGPLRRAHRRAAGCCPPCGYNLTGLIERRCPECGTGFDPQSVGWVAKPTC